MLQNGKLKTVTIKEESDYSKFKFMRGNRAIIPAHVRKLKTSMLNDGIDLLWENPIRVNQAGEIIDGQHRFCALQELGLPIVFQETGANTIQDIICQNTNRVNWTSTDYLKAFVAAGYEEYIKINNLIEEFGVFDVASVLVLVCPGSVEYQQFKLGGLKVKAMNMINARKTLTLCKRIIQEFGLQAKFRAKVFTRAIVGIISHPHFNEDIFISRLKKKGVKEIIERAWTVNTLREHLIDIFNYNTLEKNRLPKHELLKTK